MKKIIIFGTGEIAKYISSQIKSEKAEIIAYIDNSKSGERINGVPVLDELNFALLEFDFVIIAFGDVDKGFDILINTYKIDASKIAAYNFSFKKQTFNRINSEFQNKIHQFLNHDVLSEFFSITPHKYFISTMRVSEELSPLIETDFVREQTLCLLSEEIYRRNIKGDIAELGVFQGNFSKKINAFFPDKNFHLFDTFEGFNEKDVFNDKAVPNKEGELSKFKNTNIEKVMHSLPHPEKCFFHKGYFPETFNLDLQNISFAFVSIDVDLYDPTLSGLEIFFQNLSKGGYIMVHDYNNSYYGGAKKAVQEFCDKYQLSYVPIPDFCGSVVITK